MKNVSDSFQAQWQENKQQLHNLLEQQNQLMANLLDENATLQASIQTGNAFFVKDDYLRIVIEIEAHKRLGRSWPCKWNSMPMLADVLTPIVGWLVSPNSLWYAFQKVTKYEDDIRRRILILSK